jgi:hypothetical protein
MEKIEVGYRNLNPSGDTAYNHKYLVYTDSNGQQFTVAGWAGENGNPFSGQSGLATMGYLITTAEPYVSGVTDWDDEGGHHRELIKTDSDLSADWQRVLEAMKDIENEHHPYKFLTQNSNSTADEALQRAGLPTPPTYSPGSNYWAPG